MTQLLRLTAIVSLAAACLAVSACRIPISEHPLTSEMPAVDERLIGTWEVDMSPLAEPGEEKKLSTVIVRRLKDDAERLQAVGLENGKEQTDGATLLVTCHSAMHDYVSIGPMNKGEGKGYTICHYRLDDADRGSVYLMDSDYMIDAIDRRLISGEVSRDGVRITGVVIKAKPDELRRFLAKHSPECFAIKTPLAARRVK
jgi:hypothetical protein